MDIQFLGLWYEAQTQGDAWLNMLEDSEQENKYINIKEWVSKDTLTLRS